MRKISKLATLVGMMLFLAQPAFSDNHATRYFVSIDLPNHERARILYVAGSRISEHFKTGYMVSKTPIENPLKELGYTVSITPLQTADKIEKAMISIDHKHLDGIENVYVDGHEEKLERISGCSDSIIVKMENGAKAKSKKCEMSIKVSAESIHK
jgi:hypothetical protein